MVTELPRQTYRRSVLKRGTPPQKSDKSARKLTATADRVQKSPRFHSSSRSLRNRDTAPLRHHLPHLRPSKWPPEESRGGVPECRRYRPSSGSRNARVRHHLSRACH